MVWVGVQRDGAPRPQGLTIHGKMKGDPSDVDGHGGKGHI